MFHVLKLVQLFDPSWALDNMDAEKVDGLAMIKPLADLVPKLQEERHSYLNACANVTIDHTETSEDHTFTEQVLKFFSQNTTEFPTWAKAARIVFAFTPNSAGAERVFSLLKAMFGSDQTEALMDYVQTAVMLRYNKRDVG